MSAGLQKLQVFDQASLPPQAGKEEVVSQSETEWYWRPIAILTALLVFCSLMLSAYTQVLIWLDQPVQEVRVLGSTKYLNKAELANKLASGINAPILNMDIEALRESLLDEPWVHGVQVRRHWPPAVEVIVNEQIPVARWGKKGLLNQQGDIFWPEQASNYSHLPLLNGPATETQHLMAQYFDLSRLFQEAQVKMAGLSMEARGAWSLSLDNGIEVVVGREQLRDRLQRFLHLYQAELAQHADLIERVDIRYTNGVAVKWRKPKEQANAG